MPAGPGSVDANGIYRYGEADNPDGTFSGLLELGQGAASVKAAATDHRLDELEAGNTIVPVVAGTGVAVNATTGVVTCTAATAASGITLDDILDQGYAAVRVRIRGKMAASGTFALILRGGAVVTNIVTAYDATDLVGTGAAASSSSAANQASVNVSGTQVYHTITADITPFGTAEVTIIDAVATAYSGAAVPTKRLFSGAHRGAAATQMKGIKLTPSQNFTGTITVEGVR